MPYRFACLVSGFLVLMPGCCFHGYNQQGYYGTQPVMMPGQPNGYPSGPIYQPSPYYQPGTNQPTPINGNPPSSNPIDLNNPANTPSTYGPGGNNSAPNFNPNPTNNPGGNSGNVPQPGDEGNSDFNRGSNRTNGLTPTTSSTSPSDLSTPFSSQESRLPRNFANDTADMSSSPFERPVVQPANGQGQGGDIQQVNGQSQQAQPSKAYAHHPKFMWVQGVVEYDEPSSTWVVMYDDNPGTSDPFGGELTIGGDVSNARLRSGDVVRITGSLDPIQEDSRGKPIYQATKLSKL